jgi:hypothetical protein
MNRRKLSEAKSRVVAETQDKIINLLLINNLQNLYPVLEGSTS